MSDRADYRMIRSVLSIQGRSKLRLTRPQLDRIGDVFERAGGSWVRLFSGSIDDVILFKKVVGIAAKKMEKSK